MSTSVRGALSWARRRAESIVAVVLLLVAVAVFVKVSVFIDRPIVDDALISIGYAKSLADGDGLRPTPYSPAVEGFSNPTWTLFLSVFEKINVNSMGVAKYAGALFAALSLPLVFLWGPLSQRRKIQLEDAIAPLCACTNGTLVYWALGGLEIGLLVFLLGLLGLLLSLERTPRVGIAIGLTAASVWLTRPEAPLYVAALALPWVLDAALARTLFSKPNRLALVALVVPLLAWYLFRRLYFGAYLPNTYYAKYSWLVSLKDPNKVAFNYIKAFAERSHTLFIASAAGALLAVVGRMKVAKTALGSTLLVGAMIYFTFHSRGDWMKEWRFLAAVPPFLGYSVGAAVSGFRELFGRGFFTRRRALLITGHVLVGAIAAGVLVQTSREHAARWTEVKNGGADVPREPKQRKTYGDEIRALLAPFNMTHPLVGAPDMGAVSLGLRDYELMDLAGLTDASIARHFENFDALQDYLMHEGLPTMILYWGPSTWVSRRPEVFRNFKSDPSCCRVYARMTPTSDDRCPDGKPHAFAIGPDELAGEIQADLDGQEPVRALARWRCSLTYREDADLPSPARRIEIANAAAAVARQAERDGNAEVALRNYSLCAVIGMSSATTSAPCRMHAERLRGALFPRRSK